MQALREQFRVDEIVEFGFLSEKFVFDYEHSCSAWIRT